MTAHTGDVVLRTSGLTKRYGRRLAVDALDIEVERGRVYGFLGPNGAGKTTTIGIALGLISSTAGRVEFFGRDTREHLASSLRRIGSTLEGQAYFPHLNARDNLRVWARVTGGIPDRRVDEVLELVRLTTRGRDKVRTYSLGMKQRLAVAAAILHDPELVILDEPTNGLDPAGIREFRELIRELGRTGKTVFVSSHILNEVEQMCDDVGIIKSGRLLTQGPVASLLRETGALELRTTDDTSAVKILAALPWVTRAVIEDGRVRVDVPHERGSDVSRTLADAQIYLAEMRPRESNLEQVFLEITGEEDAGA